MARTQVKAAARRAESSPALEFAARAGYVADGIVHVLVGALVLVIAFGGDGESDQSGAFKAVAGAPLGFVVLWLLAITLWALAVWKVLDGILARSSSSGAAGRAQKWGRRASAWGQALLFAALGGIAAAVAIGARPDGEQTAEDASRGLLVVAGGPVVLALIGAAIAIGGVVFIVMGIRRSFRVTMSIPPGGTGRAVTTLGVAGYVAKGAALAIVGILLIVAAASSDADVAGGLDGAVDALLLLPSGPVIVGLVGAGFVAYGVFTVLRARYMRM
jgi:hypothetical protein